MDNYRATIVESYRVYWTNITSSQIMVIPADQENKIIEISDDREQPIIDRSDVLGDYDLISDDDYYDMKVSETQTQVDTQEFEGFTVLPILENAIKDQDSESEREAMLLSHSQGMRRLKVFLQPRTLPQEYAHGGVLAESPPL